MDNLINEQFTIALNKEIEQLTQKEADLKLLKNNLRLLYNNEHSNSQSLLECIDLLKDTNIKEIVKQKEYIGDFIKNKFNSFQFLKSICTYADTHNGIYYYTIDNKYTVYIYGDSRKEFVIRYEKEYYDNIESSLFAEINNAKSQLSRCSLKDELDDLNFRINYLNKMLKNDCLSYKKYLHPISAIICIYGKRKLRKQAKKVECELTKEGTKEQQLTELQLNTQKYIQQQIDLDNEFIKSIQEDIDYFTNDNYKFKSYLIEENYFVKEIMKVK